MNRLVRISGILLLSLYAFFFASTNLFIHTHEGPYYKIVHSHPWSGKAHGHTSQEVQLINIVSDQTCLAGNGSETPDCPVLSGTAYTTALPEILYCQDCRLLSDLRAPPCL